MSTGILYDKRFLDHDTGAGHPESPERLISAMNYLEKCSWYPELKTIDAQTTNLDWILTTHSKDYIDRAQKTCEEGYRNLDSQDVGISKNSYTTALLAAGSAIELADQMMKGEIQNGFALLRPPGHHAENNSAMGFCLFNNIAITARYLQKQYKLDKILILDWDVHHGNGTQHSFESDPSVLYVSLHQYPFYPGTGSASETGVSKGKGATLNCPMPSGSTDLVYHNVFRDRILPKLHEFKPEAILISAGFDAHSRDPLANMSLSAECFGWMTERLMEIANQYSNNRIISLLEGGYDLQALPLCIESHLTTLLGTKW